MKKRNFTYKSNQHEGRRSFIRNSGIFVVSSGIFADATGVDRVKGILQEEEEISPAEDLMREHGVLQRLLLVYDEVGKRLSQNQDYPPEVLSGAAGIIRSFVEDYHEKLEEQHLFPRFRKANTMTDLVTTLQKQHNAGRQVTDKILQISKQSSKLTDASQKTELMDYLAAYSRMYRPHESREDTVLFPKFKEIVSSNEYDSLGEDFEKKEHELFGEDGFATMVDKVAQLEKKIGVHDLSKFTPKVG